MQDGKLPLRPATSESCSSNLKTPKLQPIKSNSIHGIAEAQIQLPKKKSEYIALPLISNNNLLDKTGPTAFDFSGKNKMRKAKSHSTVSKQDSKARVEKSCRPSSSKRERKLTSMRELTKMLPWNNPKTSRKRIPVVKEAPFELHKRNTIKDLAKQHQKKRRNHSQLNSSKKPAMKRREEDMRVEQDTTKPVIQPSRFVSKLIGLTKLDLGQLQEKSKNPVPVMECLSDDSVKEEGGEFASPGTFNIEGFQIQKSGLTMVPSGKLPMNVVNDSSLISLGFLGKGACGQVFEMIHVPTMTLVAVKTIPCFEPSKRNQLVKELRALHGNLVSIESDSEAACPYIVAFYDAYISPTAGHLSIVMEYMDGGSLQDVVDSGGCNCEDTLANIAENTLRGLLFLHNKNQIHRDIKPSNLLINHKGEIKISDFGIIRDVVDEQVNTFVGTLIYMSPERINGKNYSFPSDIWSLGLSLLACGLGRFPIDTDGGYWGVMNSLNNMPIPNLPSKDFSTNIIDFISCCTEKDPEKRPSAEKLLAHPFLIRKVPRPPSAVNCVADVKERLEEICSKYAQFKLDAVLKPASKEVVKKTMKKNKDTCEMGRCTCTVKGKCSFCMTTAFHDSIGACTKSEITMSHISKLESEDCTTLANQLSLPVKWVATRMNHHLDETNEYLRRYRLYQQN